MRPDVEAAMAERKRRRNRRLFVRAAFRVLAVGVIGILLLVAASKTISKNSAATVEAYAADAAAKIIAVEVSTEKP